MRPQVLLLVGLVSSMFAIPSTGALPGIVPTGCSNGTVLQTVTTEYLVLCNSSDGPIVFVYTECNDEPGYQSDDCIGYEVLPTESSGEQEFFQQISPVVGGDGDPYPQTQTACTTFLLSNMHCTDATLVDFMLTCTRTDKNFNYQFFGIPVNYITERHLKCTGEAGGTSRIVLGSYPLPQDALLSAKYTAAACNAKPTVGANPAFEPSCPPGYEKAHIASPKQCTLTNDASGSVCGNGEVFRPGVIDEKKCKGGDIDNCKIYAFMKFHVSSTGQSNQAAVKAIGGTTQVDVATWNGCRFNGFICTT